MIGIKNKLFLLLIIDNEIQVNLTAGILTKFIIKESTSLFCPIAEVIFTDTTGLVIDNYSKLCTGSLIFKAGYAGESGIEDITAHNHVLVTQKPSQLFTGLSSRSLTFDIVTWSDIGPKLTYGDHVRHFPEGSASSVITALCAEEGIETGIIEPSIDAQFYIQAQWTNAQFIRYLADKAVSSTNQRGFLYFTDREGKLTFSSPKYLYDQNVSNPIKLVFANNPEYYSEHKDTVILSWTIKSNAQLYISSSSYGTVFKYFNPEEYKYNEELKQMSAEVSNFNFSAASLLNTQFSDYSTSDYLGTKIVDDITMNTRAMSSLMDMSVLVNYNDNIKLGSVIEFYSYSTDEIEATNKVIIDAISSKWVVCDISHQVDKKSMNYYSWISVTRSGIGSKNTTNLMK